MNLFRKTVLVFVLTSAVLGIAPAAAAGTLHVLQQFNQSGSNGNTPSNPMLEVGPGEFIGDTAVGGSSGQGLLYFVTSGGKYTILHNFSGGDDGYQPGALSLGLDGRIYGAALFGANGWGSVFRLSRRGHSKKFAFDTIYAFGGGEGAQPNGVIQARDGNFYGTTSGGGYLPFGTIFKMTPAGSVSDLYNFTSSQQMFPSQLVEVADGVFYGALFGNGASGYLFRITSSGQFTILYSFSGGADGQGPLGLVLAPDGNLYGTTRTGGSYGGGTLFSITPAGAFSILHSFTGGPDGSSLNGLSLGLDGTLYGTTETGGVHGAGTIFQYVPGGSLSTLYAFTGGTDGCGPSAAVTQGSDGNLYGSTVRCGTGGNGTLFQFMP